MNRSSILALGILFLTLGACQRQPSRISLEPPASAPRVEIPETLPSSSTPLPPAKWPSPAPPPALGKPPRPHPLVYQRAERDFDSGKYTEAAYGYERYLQDYPSRGNEDRVLLRLGISYALSSEGIANLRKSRMRLERLLARYPGSQYRPQAEVILNLQKDVEQLRTEMQGKEERIKVLTDELNKLKDIDIKRQPSRPIK